MLELADVTFTGLRYGSERDGKLVTIAEAENAGGSGFDHDTLDAIAEVAAYLPRLQERGARNGYVTTRRDEQAPSGRCPECTPSRGVSP